MKKVLIFLVIVIILAAAVAVAGYAPLRVGHDGTHLMHAKTTGWTVIPDPDRTFDWRWELLIPGYTEILAYPRFEETLLIRLDQDLPSADIYAPVLEGTPSFRVRIELDVVAAVRSDHLPELAADGLTPESYDDWFDQLSARAGNAVHDTVRASIRDENLSSLSDPVAQLLEDIEAVLVTRFPELEIVSITPRRVEIPDLALYALARETYREVQDARRAALLEAESDLALRNAAQQDRMDLFSQYGEILDRYPVLLEYLSIVAETGGDPLGLSDLAQLGGAE